MYHQNVIVDAKNAHYLRFAFGIEKHSSNKCINNKPLNLIQYFIINEISMMIFIRIFTKKRKTQITSIFQNLIAGRSRYLKQ